MWSGNRRLAFLAAGALVTLGASAVHAAEIDLAALEVVPQRGQTRDQARRDRYECHNWAVDQTGVVPLRPSARDRRERKVHRAERVARVINGALIGASIGGLVRAVQDRDPDNGVLAGGAVGAAVGAATGRAREREALDAEANDYLRALTACLEGRGYRVSLPSDDETAGELVARR
ncbi:MAG TPA: hypothetical protein VIN61_02045 [Gammaproteobacteria bacterium]